jgi:hypothetical protein
MIKTVAALRPKRRNRSHWVEKVSDIAQSRHA